MKDVVLELVERLINVENEIKLLQEDKRNLFDEYKEKLDVKAVKAAIQIAKIKSRLGDSEIEVDRILEDVESRITLGG
tara:strand:- start:120 stop:353 length:234 start_codon:yes stop_codon:yes gene_type:complete